MRGDRAQCQRALGNHHQPLRAAGNQHVDTELLCRRPTIRLATVARRNDDDSATSKVEQWMELYVTYRSINIYEHDVCHPSRDRLALNPRQENN
jgi:hypothetical protein